MMRISSLLPRAFPMGWRDWPLWRSLSSTVRELYWRLTAGKWYRFWAHHRRKSIWKALEALEKCKGNIRKECQSDQQLTQHEWMQRLLQLEARVEQVEKELEELRSERSPATSQQELCCWWWWGSQAGTFFQTACSQ